MDPNLEHALLVNETDITGTMGRFSDNEALYITCLRIFLEDKTILQLEQALDAKAWDDAFTASHALKGLAANMGFIPLYHAVAELVLIIRAGRLKEIDASMIELKRAYNSITSAIRTNCFQTPKGE